MNSRARYSILCEAAPSNTIWLCTEYSILPFCSVNRRGNHWWNFWPLNRIFFWARICAGSRLIIVWQSRTILNANSHADLQKIGLVGQFWQWFSPSRSKLTQKECIACRMTYELHERFLHELSHLWVGRHDVDARINWKHCAQFSNLY